VLTLLALACSGPPSSPAEPKAARPNFLIIDIDTFSVDHLGATRDGRPVTPNMDALAARGTRFTNATANSGWTFPSLVALLTGTLPVATEVEGGSIRFRAAGVRDLPEILGYYDYTTAAFWGPTLPGPVSDGMSGSFDTVPTREAKERAPPTDLLTTWLAAPPKEPFFAYVHEIDLHNPLAFDPEGGVYPFDHDGAGITDASYQGLYRAFEAKLGATAAQEAVRARYDGVLNLYDAVVGRIIATLDETGLAARTVVVLTSDHGEDFFAHATMEHGILYDSTLRIPLVVVDPLHPGPMIIDAGVQTVDLAPTLLERVGIPVDAGMHGRSYLSLFSGGTRAEVPTFSLSERCHVSIRTREWKLILRDARPRGDRAWYPAGQGVDVRLTDFVRDNGLAELELPRCSAVAPLARPEVSDEPGESWAEEPPEGEQRRIGRGAGGRSGRGPRAGGPGAGGGPRGGAGAGAAAGRAADGGAAGPLRTQSVPTGTAPTPADLLLELYDLSADPTETTNLVAEQPARAAELLRPLLAMVVDRDAAADGTPRQALRPDQARKIQEQGYWGMVTPEGQ
jgi:hypothetical protein